MNQRDRNYLLLQCCIGPAIVNVVINAGLGWAATRTLAVVPLWGVPGVAGDLAGTAFGVTFGTCLGMVLQIKRDLAHGKIGPLDAPPGMASLVARFPAGTLARSVVLGAVSIPLFAVPVIAVLAVVGVGAMGRGTFIELKALFAALEAAVVAPPLAVAALGSALRTRPATAQIVS
jgi:hypothetical protein